MGIKESLEKLARCKEIKIFTEDECPTRIKVAEQHGTIYIGPNEGEKNLSWQFIDTNNGSPHIYRINSSGLIELNLQGYLGSGKYLISSTGKELPKDINYEVVSTEEYRGIVKRTEIMRKELDNLEERMRRETRPHYPQAIGGVQRY